jgi:predicted  nucleic acid-binding Zn-ribbon protein
MSTPIELLNQSITNLGTAVRDMNTANAAQNNTLRPGFTDIANSLDGLKTRVMNLIASVRQLGNYIKQLESERGANISDIGTNTEDANELKRQIAKLREDYNTLRQELLNSQKQNQTLQSNLDTVTENLDECNAQKAQLEGDAIELNKRIVDMQAEIDRLKNLPKPDPQEIQDLKAEAQRLKYEIQQRQQALDNLNNVVIPGLNKQISDLKASIAPLQKEIANLKASIAPLQQQIAKCNTDLEEANRNIAALQAQNRDLTDQITASTAAITKIIATVNASRFKIDPNLTQGITEQRDELSAQIGRLEDIVNSLLPGKGSSSGRGFSPKVANVSKASSETRALPTGWYSAVDPDTGTTYYINDTTKKSQWDFPVIPSSTSSSSSSSSSLSSSSSGKYGSFLDEEPSDSSSSEENTPPGSARASIMRRPYSSSSSDKSSDIFGTPTVNAYGEQVNAQSNLSKQPSLISSPNVISNIPDNTTVKIEGVTITLGKLKTLLINKSRTQSNSLNNKYNKAYSALVRLNNVSEVPQIFTDNKINIANDGSGKITLSQMSGGGRKSKKTKKRRKIRKQKGGFEYSGKSKRRRLTVTRSSSSPRSSSQRSSYETQSSVPTKYKARGTKKSKM